MVVGSWLHQLHRRFIPEGEWNFGIRTRNCSTQIQIRSRVLHWGESQTTPDEDHGNLDVPRCYVPFDDRVKIRVRYFRKISEIGPGEVPKHGCQINSRLLQMRNSKRDGGRWMREEISTSYNPNQVKPTWPCLDQWIKFRHVSKSESPRRQCATSTKEPKVGKKYPIASDRDTNEANTIEKNLMVCSLDHKNFLWFMWSRYLASCHTTTHFLAFDDFLCASYNGTPAYDGYNWKK